MVNGISGIKPGIKTSGIEIKGIKDGKFKSELERSRINKDAGIEKGISDEKIQNNKLSGIKEIAADRMVVNKEMLIKDIFQNLDAGHKKIESLLKVSVSGVRLSQQELLTLQMRVYRFTQEVELISKLVEKGTTGVKQVVNTQV